MRFGHDKKAYNLSVVICRGCCEFLCLHLLCALPRQIIEFRLEHQTVSRYEKIHQATVVNRLSWLNKKVRAAYGINWQRDKQVGVERSELQQCQTECQRKTTVWMHEGAGCQIGTPVKYSKPPGF